MKKAFIVRCSPSYISRLSEVLENKEIVIGWSHAHAKLSESDIDRDKIKEAILEQYPHYKEKSRSLGQAAGYLHRFVVEMDEGDYAIVPSYRSFYVGIVKSKLITKPEFIDEDTVLRKEVDWLNGGKPIERKLCSASLNSRLKYQGTCVSASDLIDDLESALDNSKRGFKPNFKDEMADQLKANLSSFINNSSTQLSPSSFEKLVSQVMLGIGATSTKTPSRSRYGDSVADVDIIADFEHLGIEIYIQVKKHDNESGIEAVHQIVQAMEIDNADNAKPIFGWVVTSSNFNDKAVELAEQSGIKVVNGEDLAEMILKTGLDNVVFDNINE